MRQLTCHPPNRAFLPVLFAVAGLLLWCDGNTNPADTGNPDAPLVFDILSAETTTLAAGESTQMTAVASGYRLVYRWEASLGDIAGSGSTVTYVATPCAVGTVTVSCTVTDGHDEERSRTVDLIVQ